MASRAWKNLEAEAAEHFGVKRNIKRGMDFSIKDTDFDVIGSTEWPNIIADTKYRKGSEGNLCKEMRDWAKETPSGYTPILLVTDGHNHYIVTRLKDFTQFLSQDLADPLKNSATAIELALTPSQLYWPKCIHLRKGTTYLNEWFMKMEETYIPAKKEEFKVDYILPIIVVRTPTVKDSIIISEYQ